MGPYTNASEQSAANGITILCPKRGTPMVKRAARKVSRADKPFDGFSKYPKCKDIVNLEA